MIPNVRMADDHRIDPDDAGQRLDRYLRKLMPRATLAHVYKLIRKGRVRINGARGKPDTRLGAGDLVTMQVGDELLAVPTPGPVAPAGDVAASLPVLHEDDDLLVVDKPAGLAVHAGSGVGSDHLVARILAYLGEGQARAFRPAPAHRLDRGTSGAVLVGKSGRGLRGLTRLLREGHVEKHYDAVVCGRLPASRGRFTEPIDGKPADTSWECVARSGDHALLRVRIATGRRHQVRIHFAAAGASVLGDRRYHGRPAARLMLHAAELALPHPVSSLALAIVAPVPDDFLAELSRHGMRLP
ncbi:MAG: RluA family pseudouridine synthase [Planctomycetota bacterium]|nr:RluA family pseudouridine synthase [Planctomycetota bacterium]